MSVHDALPSDVYVDSNGLLWEVVSTCQQPTVTMKRIYRESEQGERVRDVIGGGVSGLMWIGFKRILRRDDVIGSANPQHTVGE